MAGKVAFITGGGDRARSRSMTAEAGSPTDTAMAEASQSELRCTLRQAGLGIARPAVRAY